MTDPDRTRASDHRSDEAAHAAAYAGVRERVTALVRAAPEGALDAIAPATPGWRTRDVLAHLVGVATDVVNGNVGDAAQDHWTAAQVDARCDLRVAALLEEWAATAPQIDAIILSLPTSITGQLIVDAATHEHDLRHALRQPGARESDALTLGLAWVVPALGGLFDAAGEPALGIESETVSATAGNGPVDATVRASTFECARAITGRRTLAEIAAYDWNPHARAERLLAIPFFTAPQVSLGE